MFFYSRSLDNHRIKFIDDSHLSQNFGFHQRIVWLKWVSWHWLLWLVNDKKPMKTLLFISMMTLEKFHVFTTQVIKFLKSFIWFSKWRFFIDHFIGLSDWLKCKPSWIGCFELNFLWIIMNAFCIVEPTKIIKLLSIAIFEMIAIADWIKTQDPWSFKLDQMCNLSSDHEWIKTETG